MEELAVSARLDDARVKEKSTSTRSTHPYLSGNYWPQPRELHLAPCELVSGVLPPCLANGQFVRNGPNSAIPPEPGHNYHMFDGDGMIHGVFFAADAGTGKISPLYVNKFVRTDVYLASQYWGINLLPSIASLIDPLKGTMSIMRSIMRSASIAFLSGSTRLSTANTALVYHDGRVLATCESGPPMHVTVPELDTVDWHLFPDARGEALSQMPGSSSEWITGHPKIDPVNGDLLMFGYGIFQLANPSIRLSIIDKAGEHKLFQQPIHLGSKTPKMMHDFAITQTRAIILDLPLTMSPFNITTGKPMLHFDASLPARFGIVRRDASAANVDRSTVWFEHESCMIFHTVNAWDEHDASGSVVAVNLVACRFKGAKLVYAAGAVDVPTTDDAAAAAPDVVHLFYYRFDLVRGVVSHAYPLSDFPIEYPSLDTRRLSLRNRFCYGASMREGSFDTALKGAKIDVLVKCDIPALIADPPRDCDQTTSRTPPNSPHVKTIVLPPGHYASEATFVPHRQDDGEEDDGVMLVHVYDESSQAANGDAPDDVGSEVWVLDAKSFALPPVARIKLPQRVPYGLHGLWVTAEQIRDQRSTWAASEPASASVNSDDENEAGGSRKRVPPRMRMRMRMHTSTRSIASFWRWSGVWAGRRVAGGVSNARFAVAFLLSILLFALLTYRLWYLLYSVALAAANRSLARAS